jgi:hypothetical protein
MFVDDTGGWFWIDEDEKWHFLYRTVGLLGIPAGSPV